MSYLLLLILLANYGKYFVRYKKTDFIDNKINSFLASSSDVPKLTQTVYGFLDFTTTIGNTVMVFSPQSSPLFGKRSRESSNIT